MGEKRDEREFGEKELTALLSHLVGGDAEVLEAQIPKAITYLKMQARCVIENDRGEHTWGATGLLDEAMLRFLDEGEAWESREAFFSSAVKTMERLLADGGSRPWESVVKPPEAMPVGGHCWADPLRDDAPEAWAVVADALEQLREADPESERDFAFRYLLGLSFQEIAEVVGYSENKVRANFKFAQAFLAARMS